MKVFGQTASGSVDFAKHEALVRDRSPLLSIKVTDRLTVTIGWVILIRPFRGLPNEQSQ